MSGNRASAESVHEAPGAPSPRQERPSTCWCGVELRRDLSGKEKPYGIGSPGSLFGSPQEEPVQDADSVWQQQQAHQQHSCTLDECFQFYTKEEQVRWEGDQSPYGG